MIYVTLLPTSCHWAMAVDRVSVIATCSVPSQASQWEGQGDGAFDSETLAFCSVESSLDIWLLGSVSWRKG